MWSLGTNRGVVTVSGAHRGFGGKVQDGGLQGFDDGVEGAVLAPRRTGTALEEGVAGEQFIGLGDVEAAGTRGVAGGVPPRSR